MAGTDNLINGSAGLPPIQALSASIPPAVSVPVPQIDGSHAWEATWATG